MSAFQPTIPSFIIPISRHFPPKFLEIFLFILLISVAVPYSCGLLVGRKVTMFFLLSRPIQMRRLPTLRRTTIRQPTSLFIQSNGLSSLQAPAVSDIFCNREMHLQQIEAVGFDMDYTLAAYKRDFDDLAFDSAKEKLIQYFHYPAVVETLRFDEQLCRRGCLIDTHRGNLLKLDKHHYVRVAVHGITPLPREQRKMTYRETYQESERFSSAEFVSVDTPFSLVDACLFAQLVELKDRAHPSDSESNHNNSTSYSVDNSNPNVSFWRSKTYSQLWQDLRRCVDRSHRDGAIKLTVAEDPGKYIQYDPKLIALLQGFRNAGKKVFLLTNSLWDYTHVVMNYLEGRKTGDQRDFAWLDLFDLVIVGGNKPAFLLDQTLPVYAVDPLDGSLRNLDAGPMSLESHRVLQGGDHRLLLRLLGLTAGDKLLYVGDHVYSDVLRSKRSLGWRTCLIVPELQREIVAHRRLQRDRQTLLNLREQQSNLEHQLDVLELRLLETQMTMTTTTHMEENSQREVEIEALQMLVKTRRVELAQLVGKVSARLANFDAQFNGKWGQLLRAGWQESRLAAQVRDNACLFTSRASNLGHISPNRPLRPCERDLAPHDLALLQNNIKPTTTNTNTMSKSQEGEREER